MKKVYFILLVSVLSISAWSQVQVYETTIEYDKKKHTAFAIDYSYPPEAVEDALVKKLEQLGYKSKEEKGLFNKNKGFRVHKGAFITEIHQSSMDYAFKVEPKSKRNKDESVIYMVVIKDGENAKAGFQEADVEKARAFLTNLQPHVETANLELQIRTQEETVVKAEKKLKDLQDDQQSMEKKIKELQDDLKTNAQNQENQKKLIENQKTALDGLKGKRKS